VPDLQTGYGSQLRFRFQDLCSRDFDAGGPAATTSSREDETALAGERVNDDVIGSSKNAEERFKDSGCKGSRLTTPNIDFTP
jgi:hypothetical protein